jgi:hypothetical protein
MTRGEKKGDDTKKKYKKKYDSISVQHYRIGTFTELCLTHAAKAASLIGPS